MTPLTGHRDHKIDGKGRVVVPAPFATAIQAESGGRIYLVPSAEVPCLEAYPESVFLEMADRQRPDRFEGDQGRRRVFFQTAELVELKGPGRITLPQRFLAYFPQEWVRIAGMNRYLELWDPATWDRHVGTVSAAVRPEPPEVGA